MRRSCLIWGLLVCSLGLFLSGNLMGAEQANLTIHYHAGQTGIQFLDADARHQLVVNSQNAGGMIRDVTREVEYIASPAGIVSVDDRGYVTPLANGRATINIKMSGATSVDVPVTVSSFEVSHPVSFSNDVVPLLTRAGCNGGACHGTPAGKNNFRLSLLGFEPIDDFEHITV
ncbi:MAG: hypothetical protein JKY95_13105, partial [Planctomycetaceae bacterium]|nr:hypothetical protein [Planctomycetaceae bacterium]